MTNDEISTIKDRLFYAAGLVGEAVSRVDKIQDEFISYAPTTANVLKHGHRGTRKRTLNDAKCDAEHTAMILRRVWEILDPVNKNR